MVWKALGNFLLLALKPLSKSADLWDWRDILNFLIWVFYGRGITMEWLDLSWLKVGIIAFVPAILFVIAGVKAQYEVVKHEQKPKPKLEVAYGPYIEPRHMTTGYTPDFAHIKFRNNPNVQTAEANARKVTAEITFYYKNGVEKLSLLSDGVRFGGISQPPHQDKGKPKHEYHEIEFNANGYAHELTIAMKHKADEYCYAYDDHNYGYSDWKKPEYELTEREVFVKITLKGENLPQTDWWCDLYSDGIDGSLRLNIIPQPIFDK